MRSSCAFLVSLGLLLLAGCGGGDSSKSSEIHVSLTPSSAVTIAVTMTQQFTASVSGSTDTSVTWSLSSTGCTGTDCGAISASGLYTAPAVPPTAPVTVKATSNANSNKSATVNMQVVNVKVTMAPKTALVGITGTQQFSATASPSTASQTFKWAVSCKTAPCGSIDDTGLYVAPDAVKSPSVTITATSTIDATGSDTASVNLLDSFDLRLKGTYAFRFSGYDSVGPVLIVGNFVADGHRRITAGTEDVSRSGGTQSFSITSGSYSVDSSGRGVLNLTTSEPTTSQYKFAIDANNDGLFIEFDGSDVHGSGTLESVNPALFVNGTITGPYVFEMLGADANAQRTGYVGSMIADGAGNITGGSLDINEGGVASALDSAVGTYNLTATGRGTMSVAWNGLTFQFVFYPAGDETFILSTDAVLVNPRVAGDMFAQDPTPAYAIGDFNASGVFYLSGVDSGTGQLSDVSAGIVFPDGSGNATGNIDQNNAGAITNNASFSSTYAATGAGRYTITLSDVPYVMYAITKNTGLLLDQASASVQFGKLEPQRNAPYLANTIQGTFTQSNFQLAGSATPFAVTAQSLNAGTGVVAGEQDETDGGENENQSITGSYTVSSSGRGTLLTTEPSDTSSVLYVINNSKFVTLETSSGNQNSTVLVSGR
ncbi:MAG TPA: hypothetical protein VH437_03995 [Terriglobales bacterium]